MVSESLESCRSSGSADWAAIKSTVKSDLSSYLYRKTRRNPMILPVIMEI
ncbi:MAG: hypothetical protein PHT34_01125 [Oscillospiraceae bacterium]|nr:hypothetical protein [Oscillospiraceae bacterium]